MCNVIMCNGMSIIIMWKWHVAWKYENPANENNVKIIMWNKSVSMSIMA